MKRFNFAVMALLCMGRLLADEGQPMPQPVEQTGNTKKQPVTNKKKYLKLLSTIRGLSDTLKKHEEAVAVNEIPSSDINDELDDSQDSINEPAIEAEKEPSAAKISYKNQVKYSRNLKTGKKQANIVSQEMTITLTKDFFESKENKTLKFAPGFDEKSVIKISYEKEGNESNQPKVAANKDRADEIAEADPIKKDPVITPAPVPQESRKLETPVAHPTYETSDVFASAYHNKSQKRAFVIDMTDNNNEVALNEAEKPQIALADVQERTQVAADSAWTPGYNLEGETAIGAETSNNYTTPVSTFNFGYTWGRGIETKHSYATANVMLFPNWNVKNKVPFVSLSAHHLSNNKWAGSVGAGVRWQPDCKDYVWGFNVFYDSLRRHLGTFQQVGAGVEWLTPTWEARLNAYFPAGTKSRIKDVQIFDQYNGPYVITGRRYDQTARGFDAELGYNTYFCNQFRGYLGMGPAWFEDYYSKDDQWAFKARALVEWNRYLSLEVRTFKESRSSWHWQGAVFLSIPFECFRDLCSCGFTDLFARPVYRNAMIKTSSGCCWETNY